MYKKNILKTLDERTVHPDPIEQFNGWFANARAARIPMPESMTLATATRGGKPSARLVLLKQVDRRGFVFFTNYNSRKGKDLSANPYAALAFYWEKLHRQVRIEGKVHRLSAAESDAYFRTRPRDSQLSALASQQSAFIESREALEKIVTRLRKRFKNKLVPRPDRWGGFILKPSTIEFWQGRAGRLHDRILYTSSKKGSWTINRLSP